MMIILRVHSRFSRVKKSGKIEHVIRMIKLDTFVFRQSGFSITSIEFVGTVFLASLFAFLVLPYFQQNSNTMARAYPKILPFILEAVSENKFEN